MVLGRRSPSVNAIFRDLPYCVQPFQCPGAHHGQLLPHPPWHLGAALGPVKEVLLAFTKFPLGSLFSILLRLAPPSPPPREQTSILWVFFFVILKLTSYSQETTMRSNSLKLPLRPSETARCRRFHKARPNIRLRKQHCFGAPGTTIATVISGTCFRGLVPD